MADLKKGDTIQCRNQEDMLNTHARLMASGVYCDWLDIKEPEPIKWRLTVTGVENHG